MIKNLRNIPGIEKILASEDIKNLEEKYDRKIISAFVKNYISDYRKGLKQKSIHEKNFDMIICDIKNKLADLFLPSLKPVINATGVILHTNLGRAPLLPGSLKNIHELLINYSNLEFDLESGKRGSRNSHLTELLKFVTGAEDAILVNNNAAAIFLVLNTLAKDKEAVVSRGELIEIGDSFRIHEIIDSSGAVIKEVGATNKTHIEDYRNAVSSKTGIIFKAHKSNYTINGFTQEVSIQELARIAKENKVPLVYDIGSGLLYNMPSEYLKNEPDAATSVKLGVDIITFSSDKLLGGPQGGIIIGKKKYLAKLRKSPLMRVLRPGKITISILSSLLKYYIKMSKFPILENLMIPENILSAKAAILSKKLAGFGVVNEILKTKTQCGGGTLPNVEINSFAVKITALRSGEKLNRSSSKKLYNSLLMLETPIVSILRNGYLLLDILTIDETQFEYIVKIFLTF